MRILQTIIALSVLALGSVSHATDIDALSPDERSALRAEIRSYLLENPEVLMEAIGVLEQRQQTAQSSDDQEMVNANLKALQDDGFSFAGGNPDGDITLVEFLDYRCGYCRKAHEEVASLIKQDGNIRWIVKELPILGEASLTSSKVAIATLINEGDAAYSQMHDALMGFTGPMTDKAIRSLASKVGIDGDKILSTMDSEEVTARIAKTSSLARSLEISGTPTFVVGSAMLRGYLPLEEMRKMVALVRETEN